MISCRTVGREEGLSMHLLANKRTYHRVNAGCRTHYIHPDSDALGLITNGSETVGLFRRTKLDVACKIDL